MGEAFFGIFCILLVAGLIGFGIGWSVRGELRPATPPDPAAWLLKQVDQYPLTNILTEAQRSEIRQYYSARWGGSTTGAAPPQSRAAGAAPAADHPSTAPSSPIPATASAKVTGQPVPTVSTVTARTSALSVSPLPSGQAGLPEPRAVGTRRQPVDPGVPQGTVLRERIDVLRPGAIPPARAPRAPRQPIEWDPAVLLLYLGAFLVVAAGLVYASYNWADLQAWQKLGMLAAMTVAFAGGGWLLLGIPRVRQAAESFIVIGALLVPANAIAAYTVLERTDARTALILFLGSLATALLHGVFSVRPGGAMYAYGTAIASTLALGALLPALGASPAWGAVPVLLAAAFGPDLVHRLGPRLAHLRQPLALVLTAAIVPAYGLGMVDLPDGASTWVMVATNVAATFALARLAMRLPDTARDLAAIFSSLTLVASVVLTMDVLEITAPPMQVFVAASLVALLNGAYAYRLDPTIHTHLAVAAAYVATSALAPSLGASWSWGAVTALLLTAVAPELAGRAGERHERFRPAIETISTLAILPAYLAGVGTSYDGASLWPLAAINAAATLALARLEMRWPVTVPGLFAIGTLVATAATILVELGVAPVPVYVFAGAGAATLLAGILSIRPGGLTFAYATAAAAVLTTGSLLPAVGTDLHWGVLPVVLAAAIVPDLLHRSDERLAHLRTPLAQVLEAAILPAYAIGMADTIDRGLWWPIVAINAAASLALARIAIRRAMVIPAILGSLTLVATVVATLGALGVEDVTVWVLVAIAAAFGLIALGQLVPPWNALPLARLALHIEATAGFALATAASLSGPEWLAPVAFASGTAGIALIAWFRRERWWLGLAALAFDGLWYAVPGFDTARSWELTNQLRYSIPLPIVLGAGAWALWRWSPRGALSTRVRWDLPVWTAAGLTALAITFFPFRNGEELSDGELGIAAAGCALFALGALVAARALDGQVIARLAYGAWAALAIVTLTITLPGHPADQALAAFVLAVGVALLSLPGVPIFWGPFRRLAPYWRGPAERRPDELMPIALVGVTALATMLAYTVTYVADRADDLASDLPGVRWTWLLYLATWVACTVGVGVAGERAGRHAGPTILRLLSIATLGFGGVAGLLLLRMLTTDLVLWTLTGIGVAVVLHTIASLAGYPDDPYRDRLLDDASLASLGLGAGSVAANLLLAIDAPGEVRDGLQALVYGLMGMALLALAARVGQPVRVYAALGALGIAVTYIARLATNEPGAMPMTQIAFAWLVMGTSLVLRGDQRWMGPPARQAAIGLGGVTIAHALWLNWPIDVSEPLWGTLLAALVSMSGLLSVHAWMRQDRFEGLLASAVAMLALLLQIQRGDPGNLQHYTVPVAAYLLALGVIQRRTAPVRDLLLAMGSGLLLVPPLLQAQVNQDFTQMLVAGGEALVLFVAGALLRLRVTIAAGVLGISVIVLRMLVDTVNALPSWITLLSGGLLLLAIGTVLTIWKVEARERLERLQASWHDMA